ncbi:hypothetical protein [Paenibacillus donghaensis]|uniref:Uncharacterized protein n=1 Tax=Paenibacillus donghaensis TaxID=414771 RepID=A0A2Z2K7Y0_9BACL|nr:hypothetical protein [Paenibacillus donghaensis]ASA22666.1 hypothetical protein B9T62_18840 [Paenibacillus donghaensis]
MEIWHVHEYDEWSKAEKSHGHYMEERTAKTVFDKAMADLKKDEVFLDSESEQNFELLCGLYMSRIEVHEG